jgi:hypothetical protein
MQRQKRREILLPPPIHFTVYLSNYVHNPQLLTEWPGLEVR